MNLWNGLTAGFSTRNFGGWFNTAIAIVGQKWMSGLGVDEKVKKKILNKWVV